MPKYRKRPVVIEAHQFWPDEFPWPQGVYEVAVTMADGKLQYVEDVKSYQIDTLEGPYKVTPGDFIITGVKGEVYPCKPDIFEQTYESVPSESVSA